MAVAQQQPTTPFNGCITCHASLPDKALSAPQADFRDDVHRERGFACVDCHGGDATATDKARAKDPARGYRGKPTGAGIITTCARCHSDAAFMRRFAPRQRVDQASEYATSVHGKLLAAGDTQVATCVSCHRAHGIRVVSDAKSPVFPTNVAATCAACHADQRRMARYMLPDGSPLPITQRADYEKSVHHAALTARNDLSAPTCNDCHGNHGAAPPGVGSIANVCGTCHAIFATKFETSPHRPIFDRGCVECHSNHAVLPSSDEMLGVSTPAVCAACHTDAEDTGFQAAKQMRGDIERLKGEIARTGDRLERARLAGMEVSSDELALGEARSHLVLARTEIHASNAAFVKPIIAEGLKITSVVDRAAERAEGELRFRRRGLAASLAAILIVVIALGFKIRALDRDGRGQTAA